MEKRITINYKELGQISPFYMLIGSGGKIESCGKSMTKVFSDVSFEKTFLEEWSIIRPYPIPGKLILLEDITDQHIIIVHHSRPNFKFKGQIEKLENENMFLFLGSPYFTNTDQLAENDLTINDLALCDSSIDLLYVLKNNEIANQELRELLEKINLQQKALLHDKEELKRKGRMLQAMAEATDELLSNPDLGLGMSKSLSLIGEAIGVDRTYLYKNHHDALGNLCTSQACEWNAAGNISKIEQQDLQNIPISRFEPFITQLLNKEPYEAIVSAISPEFPHKAILVAQGIKAILVIPVFLKGKCWGFIGYDDCKNERSWTTAELNLLKSFANSIENAIAKAETAKELYNMALFTQEDPDPVIRINLKGELVLRNKASEVFDQLYINGKKRSDKVLFKYLSRSLSIESRELAFEGENDRRFYLVRSKVSESNEYINIYLRDVTESKINERKLKIQEEKYRNIITNMNLGLLEVDKDDMVQFCNHSFTVISGYEFDEIKGKHAASMFLHDPQKPIIEEKNQLRTEGAADSYEILARNKQGEKRWWLISGAPNYNDQGEIIGSIGIHLDITEQKRLEADLEKALLSSREASKAKEAFLANMSHEIRTPLNAIIGMIRELNKEELSQKQRGYLNSAQKASQHLLSIVNDILDISKIEAGELKLEQTHFYLREVMVDVENILRNQAIQKHIEFLVQVEAQVSEVFIGDPAIIRQILINLAGNAIKFTQQGFVKIHCGAGIPVDDHQQLSIHITDTGIGMDDEFVQRVFTKFQQEDKSSSRKFGGTGLGMVITKELIELLQGEISIKSQKGKGSEVVIQFDLPIGDHEKVERAEQFLLTHPLENKSVLLVEDNEMNRLVATNALLPYLLKVSEAENGEEAISLLKINTYDLILMDIQMPVMDGLQATHIIRNELKITTPIVALTANAFKSEIETCLAAGMNDFVTKPFEEHNLIQVISKALAGQQAMPEQKMPSATKAKQSEKLYSLDQLRTLGRGDPQFVMEMLQLFVETIPPAVASIQNALQNGDLDVIRKTAHNIKPNVEIMMIESIVAAMQELSHYPDETLPSAHLRELVNRVCGTLTQLVGEIQEQEL